MSNSHYLFSTGMNLKFTLGSATHKACKDPDTGLVHPYLEIADAKTRAHCLEAAGDDVVVGFRFMGLTDTLEPPGSRGNCNGG